MAKGNIPSQHRGYNPPAKKPAIEVAPAAASTYHLPPSWRINKMDWDGPFGWHVVNGVTARHNILRKLADFERMLWRDILINPNNHEVDVTKLSKDAQRRLADLKLDDVVKHLSLRLAGAERIWGIKKGETVLLLWWDPTHQVCPCAK